ncbi:MAG: tetratricopeptide repeat protein [Siphonobacter sp.]
MHVLFAIILLISCGKQSEQEAYQFFIRGNEQLLFQNYSQAIYFYSEAIKKKPEFPEALTNRGLAYIEEGKTDKALEDLDKSLQINNKLGSTYQVRGQLYTALNDFNKARTDLEQAVKIVPDSSTAWALLGNAQYMTGQEDLSFHSFTKAQELKPGNYLTYALRGWVYVLQKKYELARKDFEQSLAQRPGEASTINNLSMVLTQLGHPDLGLEKANDAVKRTHGKLLAYAVNNRAYALLGLNRLPEAIEEIERSLRLDDQNAWAYRNRAIYYLKTQQANKALEDLQHAEQLDASVEDLYFQLGNAYKALGKDPQSCVAWKKGASLGEAHAKVAALGCP